MVRVRRRAPGATVRALVLAVAAAATVSCHDCGSNAPAWTVEEVHVGIGLEGGHRDLACAACHGPSSLEGVDGSCESCHLDVYEATADPNHGAAGFPTTCAECHSSLAWQPITIDHAALGFALEGVHGRVRCVSCHTHGYVGTATTCLNCHAHHEPDDHFGPDCAACHGLTDWTH